MCLSDCRGWAGGGAGDVRGVRVGEGSAWWGGATSSLLTGATSQSLVSGTDATQIYLAFHRLPSFYSPSYPQPPIVLVFSVMLICTRNIHVKKE